MNKWINENTLYEVRAGSHAYGTNIKSSDVDIKGVVFPPAATIIGLEHFATKTNNDSSQKNTAETVDKTFYSLQAFTKMAIDSNPNVLEMLFVDSSDIIGMHEDFAPLYENRDAFLSRAVRSKMAGYAKQQEKLTFMKREGTNPPEVRANYSTKPYMHACRLYMMGIQLFETGVFQTKRSEDEREFLLACRQGKHNPVEARENIARLESDFFRAANLSALPDTPDRDRIQDILMKITWERLSKEMCSH